MSFLIATFISNQNKINENYCLATVVFFFFFFKGMDEIFDTQICYLVIEKLYEDASWCPY